MVSLSVKEGTSAGVEEPKGEDEEIRRTKGIPCSGGPVVRVEGPSQRFTAGFSSVLELSHVPTSEAEDLPSSADARPSSRPGELGLLGRCLSMVTLMDLESRLVGSEPWSRALFWGEAL